MIYVSRYVDASPSDPRHGHKLPVAMELIGPFPDRTTAFSWATDVANNPGDDPRWSLVVSTTGDLPTTIRRIVPPPTPIDMVREALRQIDVLVSGRGLSHDDSLRRFLAIEEQVRMAWRALDAVETK